MNLVSICLCGILSLNDCINVELMPPMHVDAGMIHSSSSSSVHCLAVPDPLIRWVALEDPTLAIIMVHYYITLYVSLNVGVGSS